MRRRRFAFPLPLLVLGLTAWAWSPAGTWEGTFSTPHGNQPLAFELTGDDASWAGRGVAGATDLAAATPVEDVVVTGDSVSFTLRIQTPMGAGSMAMRGAVDGDRAAGVYDMTIESMQAPMKGRWSVTRK